MKTNGLNTSRTALAAGALIALSLGTMSGNYANNYIPSNWGNQPIQRRGKFKKNQRKQKK